MISFTLYFKVLFMSSQKKPLEDLSEIRKIMERSSKFLSLSGLSGIFAGVFALGGAIWAYKILDYGGRFYDRDFTFQDGVSKTTKLLLLDGLIVLILSLFFAYFFTRRKAQRMKLPMWDYTAKRLLFNLAIPLLTGGVFCLALILKYGLIELVAPSCLIFYGLALLNAAKFAVDELRWLGMSEIVLGLIALFLPGYGLVFWAIGFGILHIIYGSVMYNKHR